MCKNFSCDFQEVCLGKIEDNLKSDWNDILKHVNVKKIHGSIDIDKNSQTKRVLQVDFAMNYSLSKQSSVSTLEPF